MMKPVTVVHPIFNKSVGVLIVVTLIVAVIAYYASHQLLVNPQNQKRFKQQSIASAQSYNKKTQEYLVSLNMTLSLFVNEIPDDLFIPLAPVDEQDTTLAQLSEEISIVDVVSVTSKKTPEEWLQEHKVSWKEKLPEAIDFILFSIVQLDEMTTGSFSFDEGKESNNQTSYPSDMFSSDNGGISFLFLDMVNRLKDGRPLFIEAAKISGAHQWQLHQLVPVKNTAGDLRGVLYVTLNVNGLRSAWASANVLLGEISLQQKINERTSLTFFRVGQGSEDLAAVIQTIPNSYWQVTYKPSWEFKQRLTIISFEAWLIIIGLPLFIFFIGVTLLLSQRRAISRKKKSLKSNCLSLNENSDSTVVEKQQSVDERPVAPSSLDEENSLVDDGEATNTLPENIFRAYDIRGIAYEQLSHDIVYAIGQAFATEVLLAGDTSVIVGRDVRIHSQEFAVCLIKGIHAAGCDVIDIGVVPTPLMNFTACEHEQTDSGIIITASHNSKEYNGCKMVIKGKTLVDGDIQRLKERIKNGDVTESAIKGTTVNANFSQRYIDRIIGDVAVIDGWKVVVDTGNGASSELAPRLFNALECQTIPLYCEFDGEFPNHDPDPCIADNLSALINTVITEKADIGFALDGDGDRLMVVTSSGRILWPDQLMMLFSQDIVARNPGCDVVFDIKSTQLLAQVISENGGRPIMWKTGHSHIKAKMQETQALLGGEFSGHIFFKERWYGFDDGLYAAARLLEIMTLTGQTIDELLDLLPAMVSTSEIKLAIAEEQKFIFIEKLISHADFDGGQLTTIDGLRVDFSNGWGLVRASNTAPVLTLRFEAANEDELNVIKQCFKRELLKTDSTLTLDF